ncbi:MAG: signal peptidase II [Ruminococcus sp.]|nr:signal peptidase II [Ruminococcus sp.]
MPVIALIIGAAIAALDLFFKMLVLLYLKPVGTVKVFGDIFKLTYVENRGVAFGMFQGMQWIFIAVTVIMLFLIIFYMFKKRPQGKLVYIASALIIGGGIGNLIDRIYYGFVIDYLSFSFFPPVCNFADYCITIGVFLLAVYLLFFTDSFKNGKKELQE